LGIHKKPGQAAGCVVDEQLGPIHEFDMKSGDGRIWKSNGTEWYIYISAQIIARTAEATRQVAGISEVSP
jgi:hypothetical protein